MGNGFTPLDFEPSGDWQTDAMLLGAAREAVINPMLSAEPAISSQVDVFISGVRARSEYERLSIESIEHELIVKLESGELSLDEVSDIAVQLGLVEDEE